MLFGKNTFAKLAFIVSGALAQLQQGSNYQISTQKPLFADNDQAQALNLCADLNASSVTVKAGACDTPAQATWEIDGAQSPQNSYTVHVTQGPEICTKFSCTLAVESVQGSTVHLDKEPSFFEILHVTDDTYKVVLAGSNPNLYWTLNYEGDSAVVASIVLQEGMEDGSLQTFKFVGGS